MRRARDPRHIYGPNLAPMVDVVLVILIFFMASIVFIGPEWFLPAAISATQQDQDEPSREQQVDPFALPAPTISLRISIVRDAPVVAGLGQGLVALDQFEAYASEQLRGIDGEAIHIRLSAQGDVPWQHVVTLQDILTRLGLRSIALEGE